MSSQAVILLHTINCKLSCVFMLITASRAIIFSYCQQAEMLSNIQKIKMTDKENCYAQSEKLPSLLNCADWVILAPHFYKQIACKSNSDCKMYWY